MREVEKGHELKVELVERDDVLPLRHSVLRTGQPESSTYFGGDDQPGAAHLGVRDVSGELIGIATIHPAPSRLEGTTPAWRLRGMATAPTARGTGVGGLLLRRALTEAVARGARLIWCHARVPVVGFYENAGLVARGDVFDEPGIGPHQYLSLTLAD
ncbi:MAG: GNAT family N-acetyltransferase [Actinomycetia bacterium]|nr:GNAT family N-acetyltransferase [Actinomycetes bacterium]